MPSYTSYKNQLKAVLDANDDNIEAWITVRGNHIPIMKGQTKEEAVKSFIEHQAGKNDVPQGTKWTPTNKKGEGTGNKQSSKKEKYNIQHGAKISDIESFINEYADNKAYKTWKEEEYFIAEKMKQDGIYAYGSQIKEAMKNVYGDVYTKESKEESEKQYQADKKRMEKGRKEIADLAKKNNDWVDVGVDYIFNELDDGKVINMEYEDDTKAPYAVRLTDEDGEKTYETQNFQTLEEAVKYTKELEEAHNKNYYEEFSLNVYDKYHDVQRTITISGKDVYEAKANALKEIEKLKEWDDDYSSFELTHDKVYKKSGDVETLKKIKL